MAKKPVHLVKYLRIYWTNFRSFSPHESTFRADDGLIRHFSILQGTLLYNQIILRKCYQRPLIPLAFIALVLENELPYHGLAMAMRINSGDDVATSCKKLVKLCLVIPEIMELI